MPSSPSLALRRARLGTALLFLTNGALFANILPRYPEIKSSLGLDAATYGLAIAAFPAGAIAAGLTAAMFVRRFGSAKVAVVGTVIVSLSLLAAGLAPSAVLFALALLLGGAADSITDVAQNAHSLRVQRGYSRSIINSFHAIWSAGAVLGGAMAAAAIALGLPLGIHLSISAVIFVTVSLIAARLCLPGRDEAGEAPTVSQENTKPRITPRTVFILLALVLIAIAGAVVEDAGMSWATLYLGSSLGAPAALAAVGYISLVGAQFVGRLVGDRLVDRFGQRTVARVGGVIVAVGMGLALAFPTVPGTIVGFMAAGFGVATLIPAALQAADELPGLRHGAGLTIVSWLLRLGFLLAPPVVGLVADNAGLRAGLLVVPIAGLVAIAFAGVLEGRRKTGN
ncbi:MULTISPECIES: MFS transporter [unclassified Microbacterium]|uniref:MFS transporter n=1 Tax=unclassified Microbacterium TaxID=2609290 RepID=UPI0012FC9D95|nr:MFS transporter [Microbacterium sp. MAH-37]MVQ41453.1 MFS transporter [Microbacterium sp. MAH-37]